MLFFDLVILLGVALISKYSSYLSDKINSPGNYAPNYDLYLYLTNKYIVNWHELPNYTLVTCALLSLPYLSYAVVHKWIMDFSICFIIRSLAVITTIGYKSPRFIKFGIRSIKSNGLNNTNSHYSDMVISGHTVSSILFTLIIVDNSSNLYYVLFSCLMGLMSSIANLINGDHYTSDVILGICISLAVHY